MKELLKKIRIKNKYDFGFLMKPLTALSVFSAVVYALKILGFEQADIFMTASLWAVVTVCVLIRAKNPYKRLTVILLDLIGAVLYIGIYDEVVVFAAEKSSGGGVKFGMLNTLFSTFGLYDYEELMFRTSYGGAKIINGVFATGAADIFLLNPNGREASLFLCGKYLSLFAASGVALSFKKHKKEALLIVLFAFLTGDITVFLIMLLLVCAPLYFVFILLVFFCFFISAAAGLKSGFSVNASVFEFFIYGDNIAYTVILGIFICAVSYYLSRLVKEKGKW